MKTKAEQRIGLRHSNWQSLLGVRQGITAWFRIPAVLALFLALASPLLVQAAAARTNVTGQADHAKATAVYNITGRADPEDGGTVSCNPSVVGAGEAASCSAAANTGYQLQTWTGCDNNASLTCTLAGIREDKFVTAQFAKQQFSVTVQVSPTDAGNITCEAMLIAYGEETTCTVHPAAGHVVHFIRGCDYVEGLVCQLSGVTGHRNVTAELVKQQYSITAQVSSPYLGGLICEVDRIGFGDSTTCTASAKPGARFTGFGVDSVCAANATAAPETCVLQNVTSDLAVFAHFEPYFSALTVPAVGEPATASANFTGGGADCRLDLSRTAFVAAPVSLPNGQTMPHGMLDFKLVGCNSTPVTVSIAWPNAVQGLTKWGKASTNATSPSYFQPSNLVVAGNTTSFTVQDGQLGDDDWTTNGDIVDPVGATVPAALAQAVPVPTLGYLALALMGLIAAGIGLRGLHQR